MITYLNRVAVIDNGNGVSITRFSHNDMTKYGYSDEDAFIAWYMNKISPGTSFTVVNESEIPQTNGQWDKSDREFWKLNGNKVEVDQVKKQAKEAEKAQKEADKNAVLAKLKISKEELQKLIK